MSSPNEMEEEKNVVPLHLEGGGGVKDSAKKGERPQGPVFSTTACHGQKNCSKLGHREKSRAEICHSRGEYNVGRRIWPVCRVNLSSRRGSEGALTLGLRAFDRFLRGWKI